MRRAVPCVLFCRPSFWRQTSHDRTLDIGGDKPLPSYPLPAEETRSWDFAVSGCAWRIRKYLSAITRTSPGRERIPNVANYAPMVSTLEEVNAVKTLIQTQANRWDLLQKIFRRWEL